MGLHSERAVVVLLLIATVVAIISRRLRLPYSVGLVAVGMGITFLPYTPKVTLTRELIFTGLLPPLIFEAAFSIDWKELRRDLPVIAVLATVGVVISAALTSIGMHFLAGWEWISALLFGVLIAATDPVSVIAIFREANVGGRLRLLIESESLFNDGTAAVAFGVALSLAAGEPITVWGMIRDALLETGGGVLCGVVVGYLVLFLMVRTQDHVVETTCTMVAAYGSFLLADSFHMSGVFATLSAGLMLGNLGPCAPVSSPSRDAAHSIWEYAAFVANSIVFLLIGMHETSRTLAGIWLPLIVAALLVTLSRAASIYPLCWMFRWSSLRVSARHQHVLFWGGLRGAVALALVLGLPEDIPMREEIVTISFGVVGISIFMHGLTIAPLLRKLGEIAPLHSQAATELRESR